MMGIVIEVCDYGNKKTGWENCLPRPLYKDGHCESNRGRIYREMLEQQKIQEVEVSSV